MMEHSANILVVDDTPANLEAIEAAMGELGHRLVKAGSGHEALRYLLERDFALILLDVQMPTMDGFETARMIRQRKRTAHVPIIFMTAYSWEEEEILEGYSLGAVDFLFKPIIPQVLCAKASVFVKLQEDAAEIKRQAEQLREFERREMERKLLHERQRWEAEVLREESRRKDEFLAVLAHELRNPLFPMVAGLELVRFYAGENKEIQEVRETMEHQVHHLVRLVDDLLDISRISQGKIILKKARVQLRDVLRQAVENVRPLLEKAQHQLEFLCHEALQVEGDPVRLTQIVSNLLNNAVRYTEKGGVIHLSCMREGDEALLKVADNGQGIASDMLERIFEMFIQEQEGKQGLGLGLTLVHRLVDLHGGTVAAHSPGKGQGSEFVVRLPLAPEVPIAEQEELVCEPVNGISQTELPTEAFTLVLVEDESAIRYSLKSLLQSWGHRVFVADQGQKGIEMIQEHRPQIAIIDIAMPGLNGYDVARHIRKTMGEDSPYLIALTGFGKPEDRDKSRNAGFDAHITKPSTPTELKQALHIGSSYGNRQTD